MGSSVMRFSTTAKRIVDDGHEIAIHTWSHPYLTTLSNDEIVSELVWTAKIIYDVTGRVPRYMRPSFGDMDARVNAIFTALDMVPILWTRDTLDYQLNPPASITEATITSSVASWLSSGNPNGVISLHHDRFALPVAITPAIINTILANNKYKAVLTSKCIDKQNRGAPYATSGKLYQLVTGYASADVNPNAPKDNGTTGTNGTNSNKPGSSTNGAVGMAMGAGTLSVLMAIFSVLVI